MTDPTAALVPVTATHPTLDEPLLAADDVARLLAVPRSSVYQYARRLQDPMPAIRIGRHLRFQRAAIERWLAGQRFQHTGF